MAFPTDDSTGTGRLLLVGFDPASLQLPPSFVEVLSGAFMPFAKPYYFFDLA
jgi:hypothetical protein